MKFAQTAPVTVEKRKPDRIVVLPPELFASDWKRRPSTEVAVGLRVISELDVQIGKAEASKYMVKMYAQDGTGPIVDVEKAWECWNDAWLTYAIGRAACDPNDADKAYFPWAQDETSKALSSAGLRRLWDEYCLIYRGIGERPQASDADLLTLVKSLGNVGALDNDTQKEVRKHLAWVSEILERAGLLAEAEDEEGIYVVRAAAPSDTAEAQVA
jgi:hypothetical protein